MAPAPRAIVILSKWDQLAFQSELTCVRGKSRNGRGGSRGGRARCGVLTDSRVVARRFLGWSSQVLVVVSEHVLRYDVVMSNCVCSCCVCLLRG